MFSGGGERVHWEQMGQFNIYLIEHEQQQNLPIEKSIPKDFLKSFLVTCEATKILGSDRNRIFAALVVNHNSVPNAPFICPPRGLTVF